MGKKCVANCNNIGSLFTMPKDDTLFRMWCKVLAAAGIHLEKKHFICEQHFDKSQIKNAAIIKDKNGKILFQVCNFHECTYYFTKYFSNL